MSLFLAIVSKSILYGQFSVISFVYYRAVSNRYICHIWYTVIRTVYIPWNHMFVSDEKMHEIFTLCTLYKIQYSKSTVCLYDLQYKWEIENMIICTRIWSADDRALYCMLFFYYKFKCPSFYTFLSFSATLSCSLCLLYFSHTSPGLQHNK